MLFRSALILAGADSAAQAQGAGAPANATAAARLETAAVNAASPTARESKVAGPTMERAGVGVRRASKAEVPARPAPPAPDTRKYQAMMIVGVAAFVAGALIKDTPGAIVMVGGAAIGLYGLYRYLE